MWSIHLTGIMGLPFWRAPFFFWLEGCNYRTISWIYYFFSPLSFGGTWEIAMQSGCRNQYTNFEPIQKPLYPLPIFERRALNSMVHSYTYKSVLSLSSGTWREISVRSTIIVIILPRPMDRGPGVQYILYYPGRRRWRSNWWGLWIIMISFSEVKKFHLV